jgi:hypothetical protein
MTTPNKKTKRNSTGSTRGRGKRPRGWNLQRNRKPENGEDNQGEVSTDEQSPEAVTNTPAADGPKEGGIKGRNVTTRAASRLSSAMDRGMTRKSSTLILQYKKKDKINEEDRADKGGVAERDGSPSDEEVVVVHRLDRPQPAPKVNQTQAPASTTKISSETRGLVANGSNPPLKGSESMSTQEPSVPRAGVVGPFTQRPMAEPENNTHPSAGNLSSNAKPAGFGSGRSMYYPSPLNAWTVPAQGPATVKQSAPPPSGTANGIGANWNKTIDLCKLFPPLTEN